MSSSLTDQALLARAVVDDDRHAFGELVRRHQSAVRVFLRRLTAGRHTWADDLAQETFIEAHQSLGRFRGDASFGSWLLGIAYNRYRNARRRERPTEEWVGDAADPDEDAETARFAADLHQDLNAALEQLSEEERAVIQLCYASGLTHTEAAAILDAPLGTVKTHLARAKDKLRVQLRAWAPV